MIRNEDLKDLLSHPPSPADVNIVKNLNYDDNNNNNINFNDEENNNNNNTNNNNTEDFLNWFKSEVQLDSEVSEKYVNEFSKNDIITIESLSLQLQQDNEFLSKFDISEEDAKAIKKTLLP